MMEGAIERWYVREKESRVSRRDGRRREDQGGYREGEVDKRGEICQMDSSSNYDTVSVSPELSSQGARECSGE